MHSSVMIVATRVSVTAGFGTRARRVPGDRSTDPDRLRIRELANSLFGQLAGAAHLLFQVLEDLPGGERAHLCRVVLRVADLERPHSLDEALLELGGDSLVHDEALGGDAALAGVLDAGGDGDLDGLVEIGAGKHDEGIASSELEDRFL